MISNASPQSSTDTEHQVTAALTEYLERVEAGSAPGIDEFVRAYPEIQDRLLNCLQSLQLVDDVATQFAIDESLVSAASSKATLGDYQIIREIGRGGMGVVYEAQQLSLDRRVALKVLPFAALLEERQLKRFKNEARAAASLDHPNIVSVYSVGNERSVHFYAMQYIEGHSLAEIIAGRRTDQGVLQQAPETPTGDNVPVSEAETQPLAALSTLHSHGKEDISRCVAQLGVQAAEALAYAHEMGVIHRDIKPANLLVDQTGHLWITDFGLAQVETGAGMTMTGDLLGTLRYMSPEQAAATKLLDQRTDVYSLGATLYELATGRPAVSGTNRQEILSRLVEGDTPALGNAMQDIARDLETIILKTLKRDASERYQSAAELAADLQRFIQDKPIMARRDGVLRRGRRCIRHHRWESFAIATLLLTVITVFGLVQWKKESELRVIEQTVNERVAAARAYLVSEQFKAAERELDEARRLLAETPRELEELSTVASGLAEEADAKIHAEEQFERFLSLRERIYSIYYHPDFSQESRDACRDAVNVYGILKNDDWRQRDIFQNLSQPRQELVSSALAETLFLLGRAEVKASYNEEQIAAAHRNAVEALGRLEQEFRPMAGTQNWLAYSWEALGEDDLAEHCRSRAKVIEIEGILDLYMCAEWAYYRESDWRRAIQLLDKALRVRTDHFFSLILSSHSLSYLGKQEAAEGMANAAVIAQPRCPYAYYSRGQQSRMLGKYELALFDFAKMNELDPNDKLAALSRGKVYYEQGEYGLAIEELTKSLAGDADWFNARIYRGRARCQLGQFKEALEDFDHCIDGMEHFIGFGADSADSNFSCKLDETLVDRANVYSALGDEELVLRDLRKAHQLKPHDVVLANSYAWFCVTATKPELRNAELALKLTLQATSAQPNECAFLNTLGLVYYRLDCYADAVDTLNKSIEKNSAGGFAEDFLFLAMAHWQLDNKEEARRWYDKALDKIEAMESVNDDLVRFRAEAEQLMGEMIFEDRQTKPDHLATSTETDTKNSESH